ncbi:MAG: hypothetical protein NZT92_21885 [Abditibacteriales bacterium]|nr:hypothetical protein [Abditibacteriales bacterium]
MRFSHNGGSNYVFVDGRVKWHKAEFANNNPLVITNWVFPPWGRGGATGDRGPWTAPAND